jgi:hypothetical protein
VVVDEGLGELEAVDRVELGLGLNHRGDADAPDARGRMPRPFSAAGTPENEGARKPRFSSAVPILARTSSDRLLPGLSACTSLSMRPRDRNSP